MKTTRRFFALCLVLAMLCSVLPISAADGMGPEAFDDPVLWEYLSSHYDTDGNGLLSAQEREAVTELRISNLGLTTLDGIQKFPNIEVLDCSNNRIEFAPFGYFQKLRILDCSMNRLDYCSMSHMPALEELYCYANHIAALEMKDCPALKVLECNGNPMERLTIQDCPQLEKLNCSAARLEKLESGSLPKLKELYCGYNRLTALDLSLFPMLEILDCSGNRLTQLNVSHPGLRELVCSDNFLTELSLEGMNALRRLVCSDNQLTELHVNTLSSLEELQCGYNLIQSIRLPQSLQKLDCAANALTNLPLYDCPNLTYLRCVENRISYLNLKDLPDLEAVTIGRNPLPAITVPEYSGITLYDIDELYWIVPCQGFDWYDFTGDFHIENVKNVEGGEFRQNPKGFFFDEGKTEATYNYVAANGQYMTVTLYLAQDPVEITEKAFPDAGLRHYVEAKLDLDLDGKLCTQERNLIANRWKNLDISGMNIANLTGLELFPEIQNLDISDNCLTNLYLSDRKELTALNCSGNQLTQLELPDMQKLISLNCSDNQLETLFVETPMGASVLNCDKNRLKNLDLTGMTGLYSLNCSDNLLETLDVPKAMKWLDCYNNLLTELKLDGCTEMEVLDCSHNRIESLDISPMPRLTYLDCSYNSMPMLDASSAADYTEIHTQRNSHRISGWSISAYELGIDPTKVIRAMGGTFENNVLTMNFGNQEMWYLYEIRDGEYSIFGLESTGAPEFSDVDAEDYFYEPVNWAVENGITNGMGHGKFGPKMDCQRAQVVTFLWRYMGKPQPESTENPFHDLSNDYYYIPVLWAVENGITNGMGHGNFAPKREVTRGQFVTFLWRAAGCPEPRNTNHPFTDLDEDEYYYKAVLWAVENGITNGMKPTEFQPEFICRREQVVTFLYRSQGIVIPEGVG